jgi:hypothetical protein
MSRSLQLAALWGASAAAVLACDYSAVPPTVRTENAGMVFIGHVLPMRPTNAPRFEVPVTLYVDEGFKGVSSGGTVVVNSGFGSSCGIAFRPGERYLVFAPTASGGRLPHVGTSSGTVRASEAPAVLRWLRNRGKMGKAQLLGTVWDLDSATPGSHHPLSGAKITVRGNGLTVTATADTEGVFQLGGLPPGEYEIATSSPGHFITPSHIKLAGCCAFAEIAAFVDGQVEGTVRSAAGTPLDGIRVELASVWPRGPALPFRADETASGGKFAFRGIPPGQYRVGVNVLTSPTSRQPYARTFRSISLTAKEEMKNVDLSLPEPLGGRAVLVRVLTPDGRRASGAGVYVGDEPGYAPTIEVRANEEGEARFAWVEGSNFRVMAHIQDTAGRGLISDWHHIKAGKDSLETSITLHFYPRVN